MENTRSQTYKDALLEIFKLQSFSETMRMNEEAGNIKMKTALIRTIKNLELMGISIGDIEKLRIIRVTGTKGKGTTCHFTDSILRHCGYKTGLYISPHVFEVRERIHINGKPITEERFASCYWSINNLLKNGIKCEEQIPTHQEIYFLMCMKIFLEEKLDVAIVETGLGAEYDYTNVIKNPVVCGVVTIALDHMLELGDTLQKIAWHKGGIFKQGSVALTVPQCSEVMEILQLRAADVGARLCVAPSLDAFMVDGHAIDLPLPGSAARTNAGLALQLCNVFLHSDGKGQGSYVQYNNQNYSSKVNMLEGFTLNQNVVKGLLAMSRPGISQIIRKPGITFYLDTARTYGSMIECCKWFDEATNNESKSISGKPTRVLLFYTNKDTKAMFKVLIERKFEIVIFCPFNDHPYPEPKTEDKRNLDRSVMKYFCDSWAALAAGGPNAADNLEDLKDLIANRNKMFCEEFYNFTLRHQLQPIKGQMANETIIDHKQEKAKSNWKPLDVDIKSFENLDACMMWLKTIVEENNNRVPSKANHFQVLVTGLTAPVRHVNHFLNKNSW